VDEFQHWIYTHPGHSHAERAAAWLELMDRFGGDVDWSGYEAARAHLWHRQLHIFFTRFTTSNTASRAWRIAGLGEFQAGQGKGVERLQKSLALGGSRPLPELFAAAGCRFEFSAKTIRPLTKLLREELESFESEEICCLYFPTACRNSCLSEWHA